LRRIDGWQKIAATGGNGMPSLLAGDKTVVYSVAGSNSGEPFVFVHGSFGGASVWRRLVSRLDSDGVRAVMLDLPGWGASEPPSPEGSVLHQQVAAVEAVINKTIGGPVHLVGHSHGGTVALLVALAARVSIRSLTLFEPLPIQILPDAGRDDAVNEMTTFLKDYRAAHEAGDRLAVGRVIDLWAGPGSFGAMSAEAREAAVAGTGQNIREWQANFAQDLPVHAFRSLAAPTTIVITERGNWVARAIGARLRDLIGHSTLVEMAEASHAMIHTHAAEAAMIVRRVLRPEP
jgi:pimeloyl-ACP methyl ester carboxylesterase